MSDNKLGQKDSSKAMSVEMRAYRFCGYSTPEQAKFLNQTIKAKHQREDMLHKLSFRLTEQYDVIS